MEKKLVPTHKYKTTVLFLDDNTQFLNFLEKNLISDKYLFKFVSDYKIFQELINQSQSFKQTIPSILNKLDNELTDLRQHESFEFDLTKLETIKNFSDKHNEIGLIFIDNDLGSLNGIDVSSKLSDDMQKILLTGACDLHDAISALSNNHINDYIEKFDLNSNLDQDKFLINKVIDIIDYYTDKYFIQKDYYNNFLLCNKTFKALFSKIIAQYNIVDYYLLEKDQFCIKNNKGHEHNFKCWSHSEFDQYYIEHYDEFDENKKTLLQNIKNYSKIPAGTDLLNPMLFENLFYCIY